MLLETNSLFRFARLISGEFCLVAVLAGGLSAMLGTHAHAQDSMAEKSPPNLVIVYTDDQGWGDLSCYGSTDIPTPNIDAMASEGMRFTDFYVSQPVCSASRASLMSGCYANRVGISGAFAPSSKIGLDPDEHTLAEVVKPLGYATACYGKWHLGHREPFLPLNQGFDEYEGIPYSNDMWPGHPESPKAWPRLPIYWNEGPIEYIDDLDGQDLITRRITRNAVNFIEQNGDRPFFLYVPHSMPHVPLGVGPKFRQSSSYGPYADVIKEIDWSVGEIRSALEGQGVLDNTIFIYASDNGPWLSYGDHAGTTGGLREGKGTTFEGGVRVPMIVRYPEVVPAGTTCSTPCMNIDILPTIVELTGGVAPEREIDGVSIVPQLTRGDEAPAPHEALFFWYRKHELQALRMGRWKLHLPHGYRSLQGRPGGNNGRPVKYAYNIPIELSLFDLESDPNETTNVAEANPEVVARMMVLADDARARLGDSLTRQEGTDVRPPRRVE